MRTFLICGLVLTSLLAMTAQATENQRAKRKPQEVILVAGIINGAGKVDTLMIERAQAYFSEGPATSEAEIHGLNSHGTSVTSIKVKLANEIELLTEKGHRIQKTEASMFTATLPDHPSISTIAIYKNKKLIERREIPKVKSN